MNISKPGLTLHHRKRLDVTRSDEVLFIVKIQDNVAEIHVHFGVWIGEVGQHRHVRVEQIPHVKVGGVDGGGGDIEPRASRAEHEVHYEDYKASHYDDYPEECAECRQQPGYRPRPSACWRLQERRVVVVAAARVAMLSRTLASSRRLIVWL